MKLVEIKVKNLFGDLNHEISIDENDRLTYVIGRNGSGKTTVLRLIDSIAKGNWLFIDRVEYEQLKLTFSEGSYIEFNKTKSNNNLNVSLKKTGQKILKAKPQIESFHSGNVDQLIKKLITSDVIRKRRSCGHWESDEYDHLNKKEILDYYGSSLKNLPPKINDFIKNFNVKFLSSERLLSDNDDSDSGKKCYRVEEVSHSLIELLNKARNDVFTKQEKIRDELVKLLLAKGLKGFKKTKPDKYQELLQEYKSEREKIKEANLSLENPLEEKGTKKLEETERALVAYILNKSLVAYKPFSDLYPSIKLFNEIVNSALSRKSIKAKLPKGLHVKPTVGNEYPVDHLSSGEQQVIILAYELLFGMDEGTLALIDEPEISMDVQWQSNLSDWLEEIGSLRNIQFILATHSAILFNKRIGSVRTFKSI